MLRRLLAIGVITGALALASAVLAQEAPPELPVDGAAIDIVEPDLRNPSSWTFEPTSVTVAAGTTVIWTHKGIIGHTVTAKDLGWDSDILMQGDTYQRTFETPEEIAFFCRIHEWMTGTVLVTPAESLPAAAAAASPEAPPAETFAAPADTAGAAESSVEAGY